MGRRGVLHSPYLTRANAFQQEVLSMPRGPDKMIKDNILVCVMVWTLGGPIQAWIGGRSVIA